MRTLYLLTCLSVSLTQFAQAEQSELEVVEVTAQFRTENVQDVPIAISVLNSDALGDLDIVDAAAMSRRVPGFTLAEFSPGQSLFSIRGIVSADDGAGMDSSVVAFLDGIYIGRLANIDLDLFDIERIEILRGPQGTISGRNAIGGAINIITKAPAPDFSAALSLTKGNFDASRIKTSIEGPLSAAISAKLSVSHRQRDGFTRNVLLNEDNQDEDKSSIRGQLQFDSEQATWRIAADHSEDDRSDMGRFPVQNGNFDYINSWQSLGGDTYRSTSPISGFSRGEFSGLSINGVTRFDKGELTTILGWRESDTDWEMASVGAPLGGNYDLDNGVFGADVNDDIIENTRQYSAELRWSARLSDTLDYTAGLYYLREKTERIEQYKLDFNSIDTGQFTLGNEVSEQLNTTRSSAIYAQLHWQLNEAWKLTFGGRFTHDKKQGEIASLNCGHQSNPIVTASSWCASQQGSLGILQQTFEIDVEDSWQDFSPKIALQYTPEKHLMFYGSIAKGFKSGGFPGSPGLESVAQKAIEPEQAVNYEIGLKSDLADNRLRLNTSLFYTDYEDLQVTWFGPSELNPGFGSFISTNIQNADIQGAELEFQWLANDHLTFSGNYGWLDTEVNKFILNTFAGELDLSGSELRQAPRNKGYLALDFDYPLPQKMGSLALHLDYQYIDEQLSDYINQNVILESHQLVDMRLAWRNQKESIQVSIWSKNLFNEDYVQHAYVIGPGIIGTFGPPRTYGLSVDWYFE